MHRTSALAPFYKLDLSPDLTGTGTKVKYICTQKLQFVVQASNLAQASFMTHSLN